jgi:hypothetical protein
VRVLRQEAVEDLIGHALRGDRRADELGCHGWCVRVAEVWLEVGHPERADVAADHDAILDLLLSNLRHDALAPRGVAVPAIGPPGFAPAMLLLEHEHLLPDHVPACLALVCLLLASIQLPLALVLISRRDLWLYRL